MACQLAGQVHDARYLQGDSFDRRIGTEFTLADRHLHGQTDVFLKPAQRGADGLAHLGRECIGFHRKTRHQAPGSATLTIRIEAQIGCEGPISHAHELILQAGAAIGPDALGGLQRFPGYALQDGFGKGRFGAVVIVHVGVRDAQRLADAEVTDTVVTISNEQLGRDRLDLLGRVAGRCTGQPTARTRTRRGAGGAVCGARHARQNARSQRTSCIGRGRPSVAASVRSSKRLGLGKLARRIRSRPSQLGIQHTSTWCTTRSSPIVKRPE